MATSNDNLKSSNLTKNPFADFTVSSSGDWAYNLGAILGGLWAKNYNERGLAKGEATGQAMLESMNNEANPLNSVGSTGGLFGSSTSSSDKAAGNPIDNFDVTSLSSPQSLGSQDALYKSFEEMMNSNGDGSGNTFALWMTQNKE